MHSEVESRVYVEAAGRLQFSGKLFLCVIAYYSLLYVVFFVFCSNDTVTSGYFCQYF